jgi:hypothetical protein
MRFFTLVLLLLSVSTPGLQAGSLEKAYFAATLPGTWAQYESSWEMPDGRAGTNVYTYIRAPDSAGRVRIEVDTETLAGPGEGMVSRQLFIMEPGFDLAQNFLNHGMSIEASAAQTGDGPPSLMPDDVIDIIRQSAGDVTNSVVFEGRATREGFDCDRYAYSYTSGGPHATHQEGELCLDEIVPFGVVFQNGRVTNAAGELLSSFEQKLVDSGTGKSGAAALLAMIPEAAQASPERAAAPAVASLPLLEAYQSGKIRLVVEVEEGSGGMRLYVIALNKTEEPFDLVVPRGSLVIPADSPLDVLRLVVEEEHRFPLAPGGSSPSFAAGQSGERGATGGKFQLTVYEGQPLFQGTVEVGPME